MPEHCQVCGKYAYFGNQGGGRRFCHSHKAEGMINVVDRRCCKCKLKIATHGLQGQRTHCGGCSQDGMVRAYRRMCLACGINTAYYALERKGATHCLDCKTHEMVKCHGGCVACRVKAANFGIGSKATHCADCKDAAMKDVKNRKCQECGIRQASCGVGKATHCKTCSGQLRNIVSKRCGIEGCDVFVKPSTTQWCANHDTERKRITRVRENKVANFLRESDLPPWTSWNKQIQGAEKDVCGKYRPDFVWEMPGHVVVLEVDEQQHAYPGYSCENKRMLDIWNSYGGMPVVMIRMNPDAFKLEGTTRKVSWEKRLQLLKDTLKKHLASPGQHLFAVHRLFYDNPSTELVASTVVSGMDTGNFTESPL